MLSTYFDYHPSFDHRCPLSKKERSRSTMPSPSETETKKNLWGGFLFAARVAEHLHNTGTPPTLTNCLSILSQVADGHLSLTDPERAGAGFDPQTKQLLRKGSLDALSRDVEVAQRIRGGLDHMVESIKDS